MAVTSTGVNSAKLDRQNQTSGTQYSGLKGVTENTGVNLQKYQNGYQPTERVQNAQYQLQQVQNQKPQGYNSKYGAQLDNILEQIQNPQSFDFSFNGNALWNAYKDQYTQLGRQASMDAMGQAAALTGGYGNSYAQQAANQANQQWLLGLMDKGMDVYDRAYGKYRDDQNALKDRYGMLSEAEATDYNRAQDEYNKWLTERNFAADQLNQADQADYERYRDEQNYWQNLANAENQDYWTGTNFNEDVRRNDRDYAENVRQADRNYEENVRQFNAEMAEKQRQFNENMEETRRQFDAELDYNKLTQDQKYNYEYVNMLLDNNVIPSEGQLKACGYSEETARDMIEQLKRNWGLLDEGTVAAGGGTTGRNNSTIYIDEKGYAYTQDKNGNVTPVDKSTISDSTKVTKASGIKGYDATVKQGRSSAVEDSYKKRSTTNGIH